MKGTPEQPRCGFSMRVVGVLGLMGVEYAALDVLPKRSSRCARPPARSPTGAPSPSSTSRRAAGRCDIVEEMAASGELAEMLGAEQPAAADAEAPQSAKQEMQQDGFSSPPMGIENS